MLRDKKSVMTWQALFIFLSTSWLWAPYLNPSVTPHNTLISTYEAATQPYSWLFRLFDFAGALLLFFLARYIAKHTRGSFAALLLTIISIGLMIDVVFAATCHMNGSECVEVASGSFLIHGIESGITWLTVAVLGIYDVLQRKRWSSIGFVSIQLTYGMLFITGWAKEAGLATLSQYIYETALVVWIAWLCRELVLEETSSTTNASMFIKRFIAGWAFINGILAMLISLAHIHLFGRIKGLYFAGDSAWLAQHGVIIGVTMLYISRHLLRGELRARQIFLFISGVEVIKYSLITPHPALLILYLTTFIGLFIYRDEFDRGTMPLTWRGRVKDLYFMLGGMLTTILIAFVILDRDSHISTITHRTFQHFFNYIGSHETLHGPHLRSALLAHTVSVFLMMVIGTVLWILFKPYKRTAFVGIETARIKSLLQRYSRSSEDFFKLWPDDKSYFLSNDNQTFVAYKIVGSTAYALADPIGLAPSNTIHEFIVWCKARRLTVCFLPVYAESLAAYSKAGLETMQIGSSAVINIETFLGSTIKSKWWRWQKNRSQKMGYEYATDSPPHSDEFLSRLQSVSEEWLQKAGHTERGFSLGYFDMAYMQKCTIHYLTNSEKKIVAFTNQLPLFKPGNTASIDLLRYGNNADNAMPFLLYKTVERLKEQQSSTVFFDLGFVPFAKVQGSLLQIAKTISAGRFSAKGLEQFKNKFEPDWQPNYIAYNGDVVDLATIAFGLDRVMSIPDTNDEQ